MIKKFLLPILAISYHVPITCSAPAKAAQRGFTTHDLYLYSSAIAEHEQNAQPSMPLFSPHLEYQNARRLERSQGAPGNSQGPLLNVQGPVIGINSAGIAHLIAHDHHIDFDARGAAKLRALDKQQGKLGERQKKQQQDQRESAKIAPAHSPESTESEYLKKLAINTVNLCINNVLSYDAKIAYEKCDKLLNNFGIKIKRMTPQLVQQSHTHLLQRIETEEKAEAVSDVQKENKRLMLLFLTRMKLDLQAAQVRISEAEQMNASE